MNDFQRRNLEFGAADAAARAWKASAKEWHPETNPDGVTGTLAQRTRERWRRAFMAGLAVYQRGEEQCAK